MASIFRTLAGFSPLLAATPLGPFGAIAGGGVLGGLAANEQNEEMERQRRQALMLEAAQTRDSWARANGQGSITRAPAWNAGTTGGNIMSGVVGGLMSGIPSGTGQKSLIDQIKQMADARTQDVADLGILNNELDAEMPSRMPASEKPSFYQSARRGFGRINYGI